jgi:hypothetical protein
MSDVLRRVYDVFARYPRPRTLEVSPAVDARTIQLLLRQQPLGGLKSQDLGEFAFRALTTVGSESDYKHFLPRILELSLNSQPDAGYSAAVIASKLNACRWRDWPTDEVASVERFFAAGWPLILGDTSHDASEWLAAQAIAGIDISPALRVWQSSRVSSAWVHLANLINSNSRTFDETGSLTSGYWDQANPASSGAVSLWLKTPDIEAGLFTMAVEAEDLDDWNRERLATAADRLAAMRQRRREGSDVSIP